MLVRSLVPTWTINDSGFPSRTSSISTMSPLVAPAIFKTSTFFDLDNYLPLVLFNIESPIITTFFDFLLHISTVPSLTLLLFLIWGSLPWSVLWEFWFTEVFLDLVTSCVVKKLMVAFFSIDWFSYSEIRFLRRSTYKPFSDVAGFTTFLGKFLGILHSSGLILQNMKRLFNVLYKRTEFLISEYWHFFILLLQYVGCIFF